MISVPPNAHRLTLRWTIGDARPRGFEMLRLSIACAYRLFGPRTRYVVCVNGIPPGTARNRTGDVPARVQWRGVTRADVAAVLRADFDDGLMEGMGWKLAPLRVDLDRYELAMDNDCILWALPTAVREWLEAPQAFVLAEDVDRCLGSFDPQCPPGAYNAGIRGLPPGVDLGDELADVLAALHANSPGARLSAEIEEQGLQAAAMCRMHPLLLVRKDEVSICSPFWPRSPELGTCGAHFVGMNARHIPWDYFDRPADDWMDEHWFRHRPELYRRAGLSFDDEEAEADAA